MIKMMNLAVSRLIPSNAQYSDDKICNKITNWTKYLIIMSMNESISRLYISCINRFHDLYKIRLILRGKTETMDAYTKPSHLMILSN